LLRGNAQRSDHRKCQSARGDKSDLHGQILRAGSL
jgi:hypothetical protein